MTTTDLHGARHEPPRVLVVDRRLYEDGGARSALRLVQRWSRTGVPVVLLALQPAWPQNAAAVPDGVTPLYAAAPRARLSAALLRGVVVAVRSAAAADVVVSGREVGYGLLVGRLAAWLTRRPMVVMVRSAPRPAIERWVPSKLRAITRFAYRSSARAICISPGLVPATIEIGVAPERVTMVLNGVEVDRIVAAGAAAPSLAPPGGEGPLVVCVGRLEAQKGFDTMIRAHALAVAAGTPHRLLILGEGADRSALEGLAAELGVSGSVHLPGFSADPLPLVAAADLFCLPSRYEGFGQSLAEALVLGTPSVAADCVSGPRELLAGGAHGDLVPVEDAEALADAMLRHFEQPERLRAAARTGQAWAVQHLGVERTAAEVLEVLREVVAERRGRSRRSRRR